MGVGESLPDLPDTETTIFIQNKDLIGIPYIVSKNSQLTSINFAHNQVQLLPRELKFLQSLILSDNKLTSISEKLHKAIVSFTNLETLDLSYNQLNRISNEIQSLPNLKRLNVFSNKLIKLDLSNTMLQILDAGNNVLTSMPKCPQSVTSMNLDMNFISRVQCQYPLLTRLILSHNTISQISPECKFPALVIFDLSDNHLQVMPDPVSYAPRLRQFDASRNQLVRFPVVPRMINEVFLNRNCITALPHFLNKYVNLVYLDLSYNKLKVIPQLPANIQVINLSHNLIEEMAPMILNAMTFFDISNNQMQTVPKIRCSLIFSFSFIDNLIKTISIDNLSKNVTKIDFSGNQIETIPDDLFDINVVPKLTSLIISRNKIRVIPESIYTSKIMTLNISSNPIQILPDHFPETLEQLYLAYCGLRCLPNSLLYNEELYLLDVTGNHLLTIPFIENLENLWISSNNITVFPQLPKCLKFLDISCNNISKLPSPFNFPDLSVFDISYNQLTKFPTDYNLKKLNSFKIAHNKINEYIEISRFQSLRMFDFSETYISIDNVLPSNLVIMTSDQKRFNSVNTRILRCGEWASWSKERGIREAAEDTILIRTSIVGNNDILGMWDGRNGGNSAAISAYKFTKFIQKNDVIIDYDFFLEFFRKLAKSLSKIDCQEIPSMVMVFAASNFMHTFSYGGMSIYLIKADGSIREVGNRPDNEATVMLNSFGESLVFGMQAKKSINRICYEENDKYILIVSAGIEDALGTDYIGQIACKSETAYNVAYNLKAHARIKNNTDNLTVIVLDIQLKSIYKFL